MITISIVSHGQMQLVSRLLSDLNSIFKNNFEVIITLNLPELEPHAENYHFPIRVIRNKCPLGFGANHNNAFTHSKADFFAVVNPDIRLEKFNFDDLLAVISSPNVGACAPLVKNSQGGLEDSARQFPTFMRIFSRVIFRANSVSYDFAKVPFSVDWIAGMFILFKREAFAVVGGFDDRRFFMYCEDVDICRRLNSMRFSVLVQPSTFVLHDAQRASHRDIKHLRWHLISMFRYLTGI